MQRHGRKVIKGDKKDWWAFNNSKIIVAEDLFDWDHPALKTKLANRAVEMKKDKTEAKSKIIFLLHDCVRTTKKYFYYY